MKKYLALLIFLLLIPIQAFAADPVYAGATSVMVDLDVLDSASTTGGRKTGIAYNAASLTCYYARSSSGTQTAITLASGTDGTWSSGGWVERDATNMPGIYQLGLPNAALDYGADYTTVVCKGASGMVPVSDKIVLLKNYRNTTTTASASGLTLNAADPFSANELAGSSLILRHSTGNGKGQTCCVESNTGASPPVVTCANAWAVTPTGTIYYDIEPTSDCRSKLTGTQTFNMVGSINGEVGKVYTAQSVSSSGIVLDATDPAGTNVLAAAWTVEIVSSSGAVSAVGGHRCIRSNNITTKAVALVEPWRVTPAGTVTYRLKATPNCDMSKWPVAR